ncbi:hypothetical protein AOLI_G00147640 [Acnodon oligacanthus]
MCRYSHTLMVAYIFESWFLKSVLNSSCVTFLVQLSGNHSPATRTSGCSTSTDYKRHQVCILSGGDQIHSNAEEPSPDFPRVYRAVAAARRQLFTTSPSTSTGSTLLLSIRSSFCRRIRSNSMTPGERRGHGRKPGLKWQVKFFLLQDPNQTTIPDPLDSEQLDKSGLELQRERNCWLSKQTLSEV